VLIYITKTCFSAAKLFDSNKTNMKLNNLYFYKNELLPNLSYIIT